MKKTPRPVGIGERSQELPFQPIQPMTMMQQQQQFGGQPLGQIPGAMQQQQRRRNNSEEGFFKNNNAQPQGNIGAINSGVMGNKTEQSLQALSQKNHRLAKELVSFLLALMDQCTGPVAGARSFVVGRVLPVIHDIVSTEVMARHNLFFVLVAFAVPASAAF